MFKKSVSLLLVVALLFSFGINAFASQTITSKTLVIEGQSVTYKMRNEANKNIVEFTSKGENYLIEYSRDTGVLTINGKIANSESVYLFGTYASVEYDRYDGVLGVDVRDVSVIAGAIIALAGGPVSWAAATAIAGVVIGRGLDNIYYSKIYYYDDETLDQSRPDMWIEWHFYSDSNRTDEI